MYSLSPLHIQALARQNFEAENSYVLLAMEDIFADVALEHTDNLAFVDLWPLCQEAAFVRTNVLTLRTLAGMEVWTQRVAKLFGEGPLVSAGKLRWRRSEAVP